MVLKATPEEIRTAGKNLVGNAESYLGSVKSLYETVDNLQANWKGSDNQQFATTVNGYKENIMALYEEVLKRRPADLKGEYVDTFYISATMSPAVKINTKSMAV